MCRWTSISSTSDAAGRDARAPVHEQDRAGVAVELGALPELARVLERELVQPEELAHRVELRCPSGRSDRARRTRPARAGPAIRSRSTSVRTSIAARTLPGPGELAEISRRRARARPPRARATTRSRPRASRDMIVPTGTPSAGGRLLVGEAEHVDGDDRLAERRGASACTASNTSRCSATAVGPHAGARVRASRRPRTRPTNDLAPRGGAAVVDEAVAQHRHQVGELGAAAEAAGAAQERERTSPGRGPRRRRGCRRGRAPRRSSRSRWRRAESASSHMWGTWLRGWGAGAGRNGRPLGRARASGPGRYRAATARLRRPQRLP